MEEQISRDKLLEEMRTKYAELEGMLEPLDETQMTTPGVYGEWSIKDVLAHLVSWQQRTLDRLYAAARNEEPTIPPISTDEEMNRLNEHFYQENKSRPLAEVLANFRSSHLQMLEAVQALSDESLADPQRFAWLKGDALWQLVAGNTYDHISEHIEPIRVWLSRAR